MPPAEVFLGAGFLVFLLVVFFLLAGIFLAATAYYYDELIYGIVLIVFGLIKC